MGPTPEADDVRLKILSFVHSVVESQFPPTTPILVVPTGSFPMKTYLPNADLDVCLLLPKELEPSWYFPVLHALCLAGSPNDLVQSSPNRKATAAVSNTVRNVSYINAEVRVVKCTIDNVAVDITANRVGALGALMLLDAMDERIGCSHLLKRSLVLIKSWCQHESSEYAFNASTATASPTSVMGASYGAFSTYAINTIVMALFNQYGHKLRHPLQALYLFLDHMTAFPWQEQAMTLYGQVALTQVTSPSSSSAQHTMQMTPEDVKLLKRQVYEQLGGYATYKQVLFPVRVCNVVDPFDFSNNLARSVSPEWFPRMQRAFRLGRNRLIQVLMKADVEGVEAFFSHCWNEYGRGNGWRPDLLIHPRQTWHARPVRQSSDKDRFSSLLPEFLKSGQEMSKTHVLK